MNPFGTIVNIKIVNEMRFFFALLLAFNELAYYFATSEKNLASYSFANI